MTEPQNAEALGDAQNSPETSVKSPKQRKMSLLNESSPLLPPSTSSKTLRRHESLPNGPFELTKSSENNKPKMRKLGTFSNAHSVEYSDHNDSSGTSSMRLLKLKNDDNDSILNKSSSSKKEARVQIDSEEDICEHNYDDWSDRDSNDSNDSAFINGQFFDLPVKLPKFGVLKVVVLSFLVVYTIIAFMVIPAKKEKWSNIVIAPGESVYYDLSHSVDLFFPDWSLKARGAFMPPEFANLSGLTMAFSVVQFGEGDDKENYRLITGIWDVPIAPPELVQYLDVEVDHTFKLSKEDAMEHTNRFYLRIDTNSEVSVAVRVSVFAYSELHRDNILLSAFVLLFLYILLLFELVHRTLAAMLGATAAIACLTLIRNRPSLEKVVSWLDVETLSLLFGMMLKVAILVETGFFDYIAVYAFRLTKGKTWPLILTLCTFTAVLSAFLDNVTTILLVTPVTIRLCEIKNIDPKHVLIALVIFSNIGGASTPVGDPPNVIIISSAKIKKLGVDFGQFTLHMVPGVLLGFVASVFYIRYVYRDLSKHDHHSTVAVRKPIEILRRPSNVSGSLDSGSNRFTRPGRKESLLTASYTDMDFPAILSSDDLKREIAVWKKAQNSISGYSRDESKVLSILEKKVKSLEKILKDRKFETVEPEDDYEKMVEILVEKYKIKDMPLFIKCACIFSVALSLFFSVSFFEGMDLSLGWIAILCSTWMLVIYDKKDLDSIFARIEWSTLIFFAALFVVMEALNELGFLAFIGDLTQIIINSAPEEYRQLVAILLFIWVSAISSAFIDNIPLTTMMVKVIEEFIESNDTNVALGPLVYALAFGACLGGNATLIGASANVVCAGVAQQHGYGFSFFDFSRIGTPIAFITVTIASLYLIVCHVIFDWS